MAANKIEATDDSHRQFWNAFVRFSTWATAAVVVLLVLMAFFLV